MKNQNNTTITLTGNLGNQPILNELTSGLLCAKFNFATRSFSKDETGKWVKNTKWHKIVAWGQTAERVKNNLSKGLCVNIEGKPNQRSYIDKNGDEKTYTEIVARKIFVLPAKRKVAIA